MKLTYLPFASLMLAAGTEAFVSQTAGAAESSTVLESTRYGGRTRYYEDYGPGGRRGGMNYPTPGAITRSGGGYRTGGAIGRYNDRRTDSIHSYADGRGRNIEGGAQKTFESDFYGDDMLVFLESDGRPINAEIDLKEGPNNTVQRVKLYCMDGLRNSFQGIFSGGGSVNVRNTGTLECPAYANVEALGGGGREEYKGMFTREGAIEIQGGSSLKTWSIDHYADEAIIELESDGGPMNAVVEVWQGPGEVMQIAEIESQDGFSRPFKMKVDCSDGRFYGSTTVAVRNVGQLEFPIIAKVSYQVSSDF